MNSVKRMKSMSPHEFPSSQEDKVEEVGFSGGNVSTVGSCEMVEGEDF